MTRFAVRRLLSLQHGPSPWFALLVLCLGILALAQIVTGPSTWPTDTRGGNAGRVPQPALPVAAVNQRHVQRGIAIDFAVVPLRAANTAGNQLNAGDDVAFRFTLSDAATGTLLTGVRPAAWVAARDLAAPPDPASISRRAAALVRGSPTERPELDLNAFYVLTMNGDATITVVDPLFSFGGTRLLALVPLPGRGEDWVLTADQARVFVSIPATGQITVLDTASWTVPLNIDDVGAATRLALQPDEHYLWAATGPATPGPSGVTPVRTDTLKAGPLIPTGKGLHEIAFDRDSRFAFVTNGDDGTLSIIDVRRLTRVKDVPTGVGPRSIAYSTAARLIYVTHQTDGTVVGIDPHTHQVMARVQAEPGLGAIQFAPGGRWGFVANARANRVHILDAASNRIIQTIDAEAMPDQVTFSDQFAYVRHRQSATVLLIPLDRVGTPGWPVPVFDFPGGRNPFGKGKSPSLGSSIAQASGKTAALVANPADQAVYYYEEGMAAPKGSFSNYGREPRAVLTVERSLRPRGPGVYETTARLRRGGHFDVIFLLDTPRCLHAFEFTVEEGAGPSRARVKVEPLVESLTVQAEVTHPLRFRLSEGLEGAPKAGLGDVRVLAHSPGRWQKRYPAEETNPGIYTIPFRPPHPGLYYFHLESGAAGLALNNPWYFVLEAKEGPK